MTRSFSNDDDYDDDAEMGGNYNNYNSGGNWGRNQWKNKSSNVPTLNDSPVVLQWLLEMLNMVGNYGTYYWGADDDNMTKDICSGKFEKVDIQNTKHYLDPWLWC